MANQSVRLKGRQGGRYYYGHQEFVYPKLSRLRYALFIIIPSTTDSELLEFAMRLHIHSRFLAYGCL